MTLDVGVPIPLLLATQLPSTRTLLVHGYKLPNVQSLCPIELTPPLPPQSLTFTLEL